MIVEYTSRTAKKKNAAIIPVIHRKEKNVLPRDTGKENNRRQPKEKRSYRDPDGDRNYHSSITDKCLHMSPYENQAYHHRCDCSGQEEYEGVCECEPVRSERVEKDDCTVAYTAGQVYMRGRFV